MPHINHSVRFPLSLLHFCSLLTRAHRFNQPNYNEKQAMSRFEVEIIAGH